MAITQTSMGGRRQIFGLAADTKPSATAGDTFTETDTGEVYTYSGSAWFLTSNPNLQVNGSEVSSENAVPVDGGSPVLGAAADAIGTTAHLTAALDESPVVAVKAAAGAIYGYHLYNSHATDAAYVQFFDVAAASVTVGTTTPSRVRAIPPGAALDATLPVPWTFGTAIAIAATSTATGSGAPAAAVVVSLEYK